MATQTITVPDIGNAKNVDVIAIEVKVGDTVKADDTLLTLESDKASMDIPSPCSGVIKAIKVKLGDKISQGDAIFEVETEAASKAEEPAPAPSSEPVKEIAPAPAAKEEAKIVAPAAPAATQPMNNQQVYAGPGVRRLAREFGVDLTKVSGTGEKGRITRQDVQAFIKQSLQQSGGGTGGFSLPSMPEIDFSQFGQTSLQALSKIKKLTGANLHRSWVTVPHVTQFDEADITELEVFRKENKDALKDQSVKLTPLIFIMKAVVAALKALPKFNSSLDSKGENLILKHYYHIGVAVDTPDGLVVPVIRDVDKKGIFDLAIELSQISEKARKKKLMPNDMQGASFTISSLGGIGGTAFTPIVNAPEVAILGVSKAQTKAIFNNGTFVPRLMLPLSLSYDHRVIDGADGARFTSLLATYLSDIRKLLF